MSFMDSKDAPESATDTTSLTTPSVDVRRAGNRSLFRTIAFRLQLAAHLSRARRAEDITEPTIGLMLGEHELYMRSESKAKLPKSSANKAMNNNNLNTSTTGKNNSMQMLPLSPPVTTQRQISTKSVEKFRFPENSNIISHGNIHFWDSKKRLYGEPHPYIKVKHNVQSEDIAYVMHRYWRIDSPRIVSLIISNVSSLHDWTNARQISAFKKGLMKAANSTNMWIITNGINVGSSRLIGDAIYNEIKEAQAYRPKMDSASGSPKLNVVGVMREDHLRYGESIGADGGERVDLENEGNIFMEDKYELNPDHTHFIIVRDNTVSKTGINFFLQKMVQYLSTIARSMEFANDLADNLYLNEPHEVTDLCSLSNMEIPVVSVVIQGGYDCARLVLENLKRSKPVVVLRGSGGLADLLAFAFIEMQQRCRDMSNTWDAEFVESYLKPELSNKIVNRFPRLRDNPLARNIFRDRILECVRMAKQSGRVYLSVLNMHNSQCNLQNLSEYLLMALFKSQHSEKSMSPNIELLLKDLYLTLDWNCPHVAKNEVLSRDPTCTIKLEKSMFEAALTRSNREEFVDLFLSHGFRLHTFVTPKRLRRLFRRIHSKEFFRSVCWEGVLGKSYDTYPNKNFIDIDLNWLIETCTGLQNFVSTDNLYLNVMGMYPSGGVAAAERKALAILTMWAVFGNRQKLAKVLWKHSDQPIHLGLVVSMMLDRLSWYIGEQSLKTELKEPSKEFADYAIGVLEASYSQDETRAYDLLSEETNDWNYKTAVDIAANARLRAFLAHPCCQKWLTNTFLGNIRLREMSWGLFTVPPALKILLSTFLIFPMYIWVRFKDEGHKTMVHTDKTEDEDERDVAEDDQQLINEFRSAGNANLEAGGDNSDTFSLSKPTEIIGKNIDNITRQGKHYSTLIRQREVFIRQQPPIWKMVYLMWNAPITKFWTFQFFYIIYLALLSLALMWPGCGNIYLDAGVCAWTALIVIEYIRRTVVLYRKYTSVPMVFKMIEILLIVTFVIIYTAGRVFGRTIFTPYTMKIMLSFAVLYFYYRLFAVHLPISPTLGPLLYRLRLMVTVDFVNFMRMALLVICSSGVVLQAVLYPDTQFSLEVFRMAFYRAFFTLFLTPVDDLKVSSDCQSLALLNENKTANVCQASSYNDTNTHCATNGFWAYFFSIQYFIFLKLILITLLYALFAATASKLQTETDNIWKFQRYLLVVDFAHRLPLPAPFNIIHYIYFILKRILKIICCFYCCCKKCKKDQVDGRTNVLLPISEESEKYSPRLSEEDYNYWRHLASEFYDKQELKNEDINIAKKEWECVQTISEEIEHEKKVLRQLKGKVTELERMMNQTHVHLETIKQLSIKKFGLVSGVPTQKLVHFLARHSPYFGTRVQRIPVPDKYVPWEVMWIEYDPVPYTKQKYDFTPNLQPFVDEDILLLQELQLDDVLSKLPVLQWNAKCLSPAGITIDRQSWIINEDATNLVYRLNYGIPMNPFGRTGLRGRGALPRWGPNHYVILVITRWQSSKVPISGGKVLEFIVEKTDRWDQLSLPVRFIGGDNLYLDLQTLFKTGDASNWTNSEEMIQFFKSCFTAQSAPSDPQETTTMSPSSATMAVSTPAGLKHEKVMTGYMDDPLNTDNSWKEVELWHFHYTGTESLSEKMQTSLIHWRIVTEDVFIKLPLGQATILQNLTNLLKPTIL